MVRSPNIPIRLLHVSFHCFHEFFKIQLARKSAGKFKNTKRLMNLLPEIWMVRSLNIPILLMSHYTAFMNFLKFSCWKSARKFKIVEWTYFRRVGPGLLLFQYLVISWLHALLSRTFKKSIGEKKRGKIQKYKKRLMNLLPEIWMVRSPKIFVQPSNVRNTSRLLMVVPVHSLEQSRHFWNISNSWRIISFFLPPFMYSHNMTF